MLRDEWFWGRDFGVGDKNHGEFSNKIIIFIYLELYNMIFVSDPKIMLYI